MESAFPPCAVCRGFPGREVGAPLKAAAAWPETLDIVVRFPGREVGAPLKVLEPVRAVGVDTGFPGREVGAPLKGLC